MFRHCCEGYAGIEWIKTFKVTFFPNQSAQSMDVQSMTLPKLRDRILKTTATSKDQLPWLKLAEFSNKRTDKNCLRHNGNVLAITGLEMDYDGEQITLPEAVAIAEKARLQALFYTSASYTDAAPKWRLVLPTSKPLPPAERPRLAARINGLYHGSFSPESFTLSQSYYFGSVNNNPAHRAVVTDGDDFIDLRDDLDVGAIGKSGKDTPPPAISISQMDPFEKSAQRFTRPPLAKIAAALGGIANNDDVDRARWVDVGMAIKSAYPDQDGLELFREWSKSWTGFRNGKSYNDAYTVAKWNSFAPHSISIGTLFHFAEEAGIGGEHPHEGLVQQPTIEFIKPKERLLQTSAQFVAGFVPPDYLIDRLLQREWTFSVIFVKQFALARRVTFRDSLASADGTN